MDYRSSNEIEATKRKNEEWIAYSSKYRIVGIEDMLLLTKLQLESGAFILNTKEHHAICDLIEMMESHLEMHKKTWEDYVKKYDLQ